MLARIFRPAKTAMQSGRGQGDLWVLEYEPEVPLTIDPLMGYTSSSDMRQQIRLEFPTSDEAVAYAERNGIPYRCRGRMIARRRRCPIRTISASTGRSPGRTELWETP